MTASVKRRYSTGTRFSPTDSKLQRSSFSGLRTRLPGAKSEHLVHDEPPMRVRTITPADISDGDLARWRDLATRAASPNPMSEPECVLPASRHLRNGSRIELLVAEQGERFVACLPLQAVRRWRSIPCAAWSNRIRRMIWDATPLIDAEQGVAAMRALLGELSARSARHGPRLLVLEWLNERGPVGEFTRRAADELDLPWRVHSRWEQPFMSRATCSDADSMHSKKTLANRARKLRGLGREIGGEPWVVDRGSDPNGPTDYVALEASGYKAAGGVAMTTRPGETEWFLDMASGFTATNRFHVLTLEVGDTTVAMECIIRSGTNLSLVKWSYDERYTKYSPGAALHFATHGWFLDETDASTLDVCTFANNEFALGEYPEQRGVSTMVLGLGGPRSARWLDFLKADRYVRGGILRAGERIGLNNATLLELCEGGGYGRLDWQRVTSTQE
jgi:CelD/BcsL family acetyltransferase involved in cellulose biosynthesis